VIKQAWSYYGNGSMALVPNNKAIVDIDPANDANHRPLFYKRVRSEMIAKYLERCLIKATLKQLDIRRSEFVRTDSSGEKITDGPSMLKIVVDTINPSTRVGVGNLMKDIEMSTLAIENNVDDMLDFIYSSYNQLIDEGEVHPHFVRYFFNALLSGNIEIFTQTIQWENDDWEKGTDVSHEDLISMASSKFKNMIADRSWEKKDPKDAKIVALARLV